MSKAAPRPCRSIGCAATVTSDQRGYCDAHASKRSNWNNRTKQSGSTTKRGYGWWWQQLRRSVLARDSYLCQECLRGNHITAATDVDHIKRKQDGGTDDVHNLESLCKQCHQHKTATEGRG